MDLGSKLGVLHTDYNCAGTGFLLIMRVFSTLCANITVLLLLILMMITIAILIITIVRTIE
jgi:hypothetical protein